MFIARRRDRPSESQVSPRAEWYDRNPVKRDNQFDSGALAPHIVTQRFYYTVPTGKKAFVEGLMVKATRNTAATSAGVVRAWVYVRSNAFLIAEVLTNGVGDKGEEFVGVSVTMIAGDVISGQTWDSSTGGTCSYLINALMTEFDA